MGRRAASWTSCPAAWRLEIIGRVPSTITERTRQRRKAEAKWELRTIFEGHFRGARRPPRPVTRSPARSSGALRVVALDSMGGLRPRVDRVAVLRELPVLPGGQLVG